MQVSINEIRKECFKHNGSAFDILDCDFEMKYEACAERQGFGYKWKLTKTSSCLTDWESIDRYEKDEIKKRLPKGITYSRSGAKRGELHNTLEKPHKGDYLSDISEHVIFTLHVSDKYATSMLETAEGKRTFFYEYKELKPEVLKQTLEFRDRVLSAHSKVIEDAYDSYCKGSTLNKFGMCNPQDEFCDYAPAYKGVSFSKYGLKDLSEIYQLYGFAMAIAEYGIKDLASNQWYCIHPFCKWDSSVKISIVGDTGVPTESVSKADW